MPSWCGWPACPAIVRSSRRWRSRRPVRKRNQPYNEFDRVIAAGGQRERSRRDDINGKAQEGDTSPDGRGPVRRTGLAYKTNTGAQRVVIERCLPSACSRQKVARFRLHGDRRRGNKRNPSGSRLVGGRRHNSWLHASGGRIDRRRPNDSFRGRCGITGSLPLSLSLSLTA